jgi:hypothetical protein
LARIRRVRKAGQPGFITRSVEGFTGKRVSSEREGKSGVRILLTRNPAKHQTGPLGFTNHADIPNPNAAPNPRILDGSRGRRLSTLKAGVKSVANRGVNRSITKR